MKWRDKNLRMQSMILPLPLPTECAQRRVSNNKVIVKIFSNFEHKSVAFSFQNNFD